MMADGWRLAVVLLLQAASAQYAANIAVLAESHSVPTLSVAAAAEAVKPALERNGAEEALINSKRSSNIHSKLDSSNVVGRHPRPTREVYRRTALAYGAATVVIMPIIESSHVHWLLRPLGLPSVVLEAVLRAWGALSDFRNRHVFNFLCAHEVATDIVSDVVAQAVTADAQPPSSRSKGKLALDWRRVGRSTSAAMLSDDFPFLLWSRGIWAVFEHLVRAVRASSRLSPATIGRLTSPLAVAVAKTAVTQLAYEPLSSGVYLVLQALMRGEGRRGAAAELRAKLLTAWRDGFGCRALHAARPNPTGALRARSAQPHRAARRVSAP